MIDIETLSLDTDAVILSIGAVAFDRNIIGDTFERSINISSNLDHDRSIEGDTLEWWLQQDTEATDVLVGGKDLEPALVEFVTWYDEIGFDEVWANSPSFDCTKLEHAFDSLGLETPWTYDEKRDYRTLRNLPLDVDPDVDFDGTEHNALDDALYQATIAGRALNKIQNSTYEE